MNSTKGTKVLNILPEMGLAMNGRWTSYAPRRRASPFRGRSIARAFPPALCQTREWNSAVVSTLKWRVDLSAADTWVATHLSCMAESERGARLKHGVQWPSSAAFHRLLVAIGQSCWEALSRQSTIDLLHVQSHSNTPENMAAGLSISLEETWQHQEPPRAYNQQQPHA